jgi:hypothetical protein
MHFRLMHARLALASSFYQQMNNTFTIVIDAPASLPDTSAMYCIMIFDASVFPAPLSPVMITHWFLPASRKEATHIQ